jgi:hypothetical protein
MVHHPQSREHRQDLAPRQWPDAALFAASIRQGVHIQQTVNSEICAELLKDDGFGYEVTMTPASIASGSPPTNITLVLSSPARAMQEQAPYYRTFRTTVRVAVCLLLLPIMGGPRQSAKRFSALTVLISLFSGATLLSLDGCGGSSSPSSESPTSYEISVMATSGSLHHSASVSVAVK